MNFRTINVAKLVAIQNELRAKPVFNIPELKGIFYREQDFTQSHAAMNEIFTTEFHEAHVQFSKSRTTDELHSNLANNIRIHSSGKNHFTSYELSPALRHFLNDSCRLLEPSTALLAKHYPSTELGKRESLNSYLGKIQKTGTNLTFDSKYIVELYKIWNDYKHKETEGLHATAWMYENGAVIKPQLGLGKIEGTFISLKDIDVDDFVNRTSDVMLQYFDFVI